MVKNFVKGFSLKNIGVYFSSTKWSCHDSKDNNYWLAGSLVNCSISYFIKFKPSENAKPKNKVETTTKQEWRKK